MMMPKTDDPQQKMMGQIMSFMPLMFGYFALVVPSGLSLYWLTSNILSMGQQYFFVKQGEKDEAEKKEKNQENISDEQLEVSPATAAVVNNPPDSTNGQVNANERRRSRSRKRRKRKK
jgi:YidC/Oxa1 family membrane protein insertase